jgi:hypothetical protein
MAKKTENAEELMANVRTMSFLRRRRRGFWNPFFWGGGGVL